MSHKAAPVLAIDRLELSFGDYDWAFARTRRAEIDQHFARVRLHKPSLWNGRVLLMHEYRIEGATLQGSFFETDFASFMAWRDWGMQEHGATNGFALAALRGSDGGYVMGVMGAQTMNAGRIYFPGGTPDPSDVSGDRVDLDGSVRREVVEETGLDLSLLDIAPGWLCLPAGAQIALLKPMQARVPAQELCAQIAANLARQTDPELANVVVVRGAADISEAMPHFIRTFLRHADDLPNAAQAREVQP